MEIVPAETVGAGVLALLRDPGGLRRLRAGQPSQVPVGSRAVAARTRGTATANAGRVMAVPLAGA